MSSLCSISFSFFDVMQIFISLIHLNPFYTEFQLFLIFSPVHFGILLSANILWQGMRLKIDGSSKTTAFYPPITVDQKDRSGRGSRFKSRNFPFREGPRVASASFVGGALLALILSSISSFFASSSISGGLGKLGCSNSRHSYYLFCFPLFGLLRP